MEGRLRSPLFSVVASNPAFSIVLDEATDTDSEDHAELRPSVRERILKFCQKLAPIEIQVERTSVSRFTLHMSAARQRRELQVQTENI